MTDLTVDLGFARLRNPLVGASGLFGVETASVIDMRKLGAVTTKTQFLTPRTGNALNRIVETPAGLLNSVGIPCRGVEHFIERELPVWRSIDCPLIVSIGGERLHEYAEMAVLLEGEPGILALEVNISCPNQAAGGIEFGADPAAVRRVISSVVEASTRPIIAKLTPNVTSIAAVAVAAEEGGASALCAINTLVAMAIDVRSRRSRLGTLRGGLSGPAIRPVAVRCVWEIAQASQLPIIGTSGVETAEDVLEFVIAGATAVGVGTSILYTMFAVESLERDLELLLDEIGVERLADLTNTLADAGSATVDVAHSAG